MSASRVRTNITHQRSAKDTGQLARTVIYPRDPQGRARFMPRSCSGDPRIVRVSGSAVRVVSVRNVEFVSTQLPGRIRDSTGAKLALEVTVEGVDGPRPLINKKKVLESGPTPALTRRKCVAARSRIRSRTSTPKSRTTWLPRATAARRESSRHSPCHRAALRAGSRAKALEGYVAKVPERDMMIRHAPPAKGGDYPYTSRIENIRERDVAVATR